MKSRKGPPILLAKVDAKVETNLARKYEIKRYPTIKVFRRGKASSYKNGAQDKRGMYVLSWLEMCGCNVCRIAYKCTFRLNCYING